MMTKQQGSGGVLFEYRAYRGKEHLKPRLACYELMIKMELRKKKGERAFYVSSAGMNQSGLSIKPGMGTGFPSERIDGMRMWESVEIPIGLRVQVAAAQVP
jgi:hypothetical protein